jgi:hypothetical protein
MARESKKSSAADSKPHRPIYIRLPRPKHLCDWTGLTRGAINALVLPTEANGWRPPVQSRVLRRRSGARSGIRLVVLSALLKFIEANPQENGKPEQVTA